MKTSTQICLTPFGWEQRLAQVQVCVCVCLFLRSVVLNLDYVPFQNSMGIENNKKNIAEHVQFGENSMGVCVCSSTWRLEWLLQLKERVDGTKYLA